MTKAFILNHILIKLKIIYANLSQHALQLDLGHFADLYSKQNFYLKAAAKPFEKVFNELL